jgi:ribosomal protein L11 methyltransferase
MVTRHYPALDIEWPTPVSAERLDRLMAALDDEGPTAVEERASGVAVFFSTNERRDRALALARDFAPEASVTSVSVSDDAWAERSQASLTAIRVGRVVVAPPGARADASSRTDDLFITIVPSMGFGTGHHASTRLCLRLLQPWRPSASSVLDVGTGSGVLAIAAWRLGATRVVGIDVDADALTSARENIELNGAGMGVELHRADLAHAADQLGGRFDLVLANLTGAVLERVATALGSLLTQGGSLIVSGFQVDEQNDVVRAFERSALAVSDRAVEDGWVALRIVRSEPSR